MSERPDLMRLTPPANTPVGDKRPCARCRRIFQPTIKRRMLCRMCYRYPDAEPDPSKDKKHASK